MARTKQTARSSNRTAEREAEDREAEEAEDREAEETLRLERLAEESDARKRKPDGEGLGSGEESDVKKIKREGDEEEEKEEEEEEEEEEFLGEDVEIVGSTFATPCLFHAYIQKHPVYNPLFPHMPPHITPNMLRKSDRTAKYWIRAFKDVKLRPLAAACVAHVTDCYI